MTLIKGEVSGLDCAIGLERDEVFCRAIKKRLLVTSALIGSHGINDNVLSNPAGAVGPKTDIND